MLKRVGAGGPGYDILPEYLDFDCVLLLQPNEYCFQGQIVCRNVTTSVGVNGADIVVLPAHLSAGPAYGVYQQPNPISNQTSQPIYKPIIVRAWGQGVVIADGSSGQIAVGDPIITPPGGGAKTSGAWGVGVWGEFLWAQSWGNNATAIAPGGTTYPGAFIGNALTTGTPGLPVGTVLIPDQGPAAVLNAAISAFSQ